jgi:hypothetical protein
VSRPLRTLREDVHIHAPALEVFGYLDAHDPEFWPPAVTVYTKDQQSLELAISLPGRSERARLMRATEDRPRYLEFTADGQAAALRGLTWVVNSEGPREVHLIVEMAYEPARGPFGWALEETVHRACRRQVLRDALWRLKLLAEGRR